MEKQKIGIDIDDVIINSFEIFSLFCKEKKVLGDFDEFHSYYFNKELNFSEENLTDFYNEFNTSKIRELILPFDIAVESILLLFNYYEIFFITSRPLMLKEETYNFLKQTFSDKNFELIFSKEEKIPKAKICENLGIKFFIEDRKKYALECAEKGINVFLLDYPWNKNFEHENIRRVKEWKEILEVLKNE